MLKTKTKMQINKQHYIEWNIAIDDIYWGWLL